MMTFYRSRKRSLYHLWYRDRWWTFENSVFNPGKYWLVYGDWKSSRYAGNGPYPGEVSRLEIVTISGYSEQQVQNTCDHMITNGLNGWRIEDGRQLEDL